MGRRRRTFTFWLWLFAAALGFATLEVPEIASLTVDTTNDPVAARYEDSIPELNSRPLCRHERPYSTLGRRLTFLNPNQRRARFVPPSNTSTRAGKDIFQLLSIQRK